MSSDTKQPGEAFLKAYSDLASVAKELAPIEREYLSNDGLGSAGMEVAGILDFYKEKAAERQRAADEMRRLREELGDEAILAGLKEIGGSEQAIGYIENVPLREFRREQEPAREHRRWFKFR